MPFAVSSRMTRNASSIPSPATNRDTTDCDPGSRPNKVRAEEDWANDKRVDRNNGLSGLDTSARRGHDISERHIYTIGLLVTSGAKNALDALKGKYDAPSKLGRGRGIARDG